MGPGHRAPVWICIVFRKQIELSINNPNQRTIFCLFNRKKNGKLFLKKTCTNEMKKIVEE